MKISGVFVAAALAIVATGCRSTSRTVIEQESRSRQSQISARPQTQVSAVISQAAYDELDNSRDFSGTQSAEPPSELELNPIGAQFQESQSLMSLTHFQSLAIENNPTIQALAATTQKAAGYRTQVGLRPNPIVGYQAVQLADQGTDQHTMFFERQFVRGGKLELNQSVLNEALRAQRFEYDAQQIRVLTDIEIKFFEVLAAQRRVELVSEFESVVEKGLELSETRMKAQEGTKVDVLQARIQKNEINLLRQQAEIALATAWQELVAIAGVPDLPMTQVMGELPQQAELLDWRAFASAVVETSPEMEAARARIARARANLNRQGVQAIPNITAQLAAGIDNDSNSGLINLQVGVPIPTNNRNQGNISAAQAELCRAIKDAERVELSIKSRFAVIAREYDSALAAVEQYTREILPSAVESLQLADESYKAGESSFVQVLVARKTFFDSNISFLEAQAQLAQAQAKMKGNALTGALDPTTDESGDDGLRGESLDQQ
ncbi:MAG: TolC family protein [Pirellulaceae bacterium]|nr:TolC family protein [Pirellulaceae bacterium]